MKQMILYQEETATESSGNKEASKQASWKEKEGM